MLPPCCTAVTTADEKRSVSTMTSDPKRSSRAPIRAICLDLPETSERPSHGAPTFFIRGKRSFATVWDSHHGDGRFALICAAPTGMQAALVEADPDRFYVPPYVGHRGWIGVRLDRGFHRDEIAGIVEVAYAEVAPPKLVEAAGRRPT